MEFASDEQGGSFLAVVLYISVVAEAPRHPVCPGGQILSCVACSDQCPIDLLVVLVF